MSRIESALLIGTGALLGSVLGSVVTIAFTSESESPPEKPSVTAETLSEDESPELRRLTQRLRALERRVSLLTFAQPHSSPTKEVTEEGEAAEGEVPLTERKVVDDPVFEAAVRDVVDRVEFERDEQRDVARAERRQAAADRWAASLGGKLELTGEQQTQVKELMTKHFEKMRELRNTDPAERPILRSEWRQRFQDLRAEAEKDLETVFDDDQKEKYKELDQMEKLGGFAPRGRRRGAETQK